jgi:dTDP-4-amino-4,6-dideoxygalactose transaminase
MPVSEKIAPTVLCLPLYAGLTEDETKEIVHLLNAAL